MSRDRRKVGAIAMEVIPIAKEHGIDGSDCDDLPGVVRHVIRVMTERQRSAKADLRRLEAIEMELEDILSGRDGADESADHEPHANGHDNAAAN
jgi:hypothetical protein